MPECIEYEDRVRYSSHAHRGLLKIKTQIDSCSSVTLTAPDLSWSILQKIL